MHSYNYTQTFTFTNITVTKLTSLTIFTFVSDIMLQMYASELTQIDHYPQVKFIKGML